MRKTINLNENWIFVKDAEKLTKSNLKKGLKVNLPHTYNNVDGQDGGNDYFRGTCWYQKDLGNIDINENERVFLEFNAAAISSDVYVNDKHLINHKGGYSKFRVDITDSLAEDNKLSVSVDNSINDIVYPQAADFTFYGGIYRDVNLIIVPKAHFDLEYYGSNGIKITPIVKKKDAVVTVEVWTKNNPEYVDITTNNETKRVEVKDNYASVDFEIKDVRLWDGLDDPYLYNVEAILDSGDKVSSDYGVRYFEIDPKKGFLLNGREYPLRGVSRHQDRDGIGNALSLDNHIEDMDFIMELGANTIRLAHYQHAQEFYDLCDQKGIVLWAEIPYITKHMPNGRENTISQMKELIYQNYNHPSIVVWGLSNEITGGGEVNDDLLENHRILNDLCHDIDKTRKTTIANVFMLEIDSPLIQIPDVNSYNLYYGWYLGELEENDQFFDNFHKQYPNIPIGFSEYGADANPEYQTSKPFVGDYTETYQTVYHEHMLKMINERPYLWATHVWNMFDFAADARAEGGKHGINQKGLITIDRKIKKDAFYLYKAHWNKTDKFVHLCGRRYVDRVEDNTEIKVYSNLDEVSLYVDGKRVDTQKGKHIFKFNVDITGEHKIEVRADKYYDMINIRKVDEANESYSLSGQGGVINWLDKDLYKDGYYSINDTLADLMDNEETNKLFEKVMEGFFAAQGNVAAIAKDNKSLLKGVSGMALSTLLKHAGDAMTQEDIVELNKALQNIKKPE